MVPSSSIQLMIIGYACELLRCTLMMYLLYNRTKLSLRVDVYSEKHHEFCSACLSSVSILMH